VVDRLSLSYVLSLCVSSALSYSYVLYLCLMGLAACNKFFVRSFVVQAVVKTNQWEMAIFDPPPQLRDPSIGITWNLKLSSGHDPAGKISVGFVDVGGLGKYM